MTRRRRGAGEGTIYRYRKGWAAQAIGGYDEAGNARRKTFYGRSRREVEEKLTRYRSSALDGVPIAEPGRIKLHEYMQRWLEDVARPRVRPGTLALYRRLSRIHVHPHLGGTLLRGIGGSELARLQTRLEEGGASPRLRQQVHALLHVAFKDAVRMGLLARNPADAVDRPRAKRRELRTLDAGQARKLLEAALEDEAKPWLYAMVALALASGARLGELLGLRWSDVDIDEGFVVIQRSLVEDPTTGAPELAETKSGKGRRVGIGRFAVDALVAYRAKLQSFPIRSALVFPDRAGHGMRRSNFNRRSWRPLVRRAGPEGLRFHDLRHAHSSLLVASGTPIRVVSERLGHASPVLVLTTYGHLLPGLDRAAADQLDTILEG